MDGASNVRSGGAYRRAAFVSIGPWQSAGSDYRPMFASTPLFHYARMSTTSVLRLGLKTSRSLMARRLGLRSAPADGPRQHGSNSPRDGDAAPSGCHGCRGPERPGRSARHRGRGTEPVAGSGAWMPYLDWSEWRDAPETPNVAKHLVQ